jgi:hypothetical protein
MNPRAQAINDLTKASTDKCLEEISRRCSLLNPEDGAILALNIGNSVVISCFSSVIAIEGLSHERKIEVIQNMFSKLSIRLIEKIDALGALNWSQEEKDNLKIIAALMDRD